MTPTVLLADPAVRLSGVRPRPRLAGSARPRRLRIRWWRVLAGMLLASVVGGLAFLQTWPPLATVMSGSMAPTIGTGDVVLLKQLDRPARVGDIVSVSVPDEARTRYGYPPVVIHRIVSIAADGAVTTKGDAHKAPDPFSVPGSTLTTRVVATVPAAGRVIAFLGSTLGLLWLVGGGALLLGLPLLDRYRDAQRRDEEERNGLQSALEAMTAELTRTREERDRRLADVTQEATESKEQLRLVSTAFSQHLEQLPAVIERAIADAFAAAAPPPPPPPIPVRAPAPLAALALLPGPAQIPVPAPPPTPDPFARRFVAASQFTPPATPDLLTALRPSTPAKTPLPWYAPPSGVSQEKLLVT